MKLGYFILFIFFLSCKEENLEKRSSDQIEKKFKGQKPINDFSVVDGFTIRSIRIGDPRRPLVVMLHGSPGSWQDYLPYLTDSNLYDTAEWLSFDRPGYGLSDPGKKETSIIKQADYLKAVIDKIAGERAVVLVGYSFGGPVAARLACILKNKAKGMVLIAASLEPGQEKTFGVSPWFEKPKANKLLPDFLKMPNAEKMAHPKTLKEIEGDYAQITAKTWVLHGTDDNLIYYRNAEYAKEKFVNANVTVVTVEGEGHGMFFNKREMILEYIKKGILTKI